MDEPKTEQPFSLQGMPAMAAVTGKAINVTVERFFRRPVIHGNLDYLSNRLSGLPEIVVAGGAVCIVIMVVSTYHHAANRLTLHISPGLIS